MAGGTDGYTGGGASYRRLKNDDRGYGYDQLYSRFYMKLNKEHAPIHHYGGGFCGFDPPTPWGQGGAGRRPKGDTLWTTQVEPGNFDTWTFYTYWQHMGGSPPRGQTWGNILESGVPPRPVGKEKWVCLEVMVKMDEIGDTDGEMAYWLDGKLSRKADMVTSYLGRAFPSVGTWTYDRFEPYVSKQGLAWDYDKGRGVPIEGGKPFPGFEWRTVPELNVNAIWLYRYMSQPETGTSKVWWDHVGIAKKYIGPLTPDERVVSVPRLRARLNAPPFAAPRPEFVLRCRHVESRPTPNAFGGTEGECDAQRGVRERPALRKAGGPPQWA